MLNFVSLIIEALTFIIGFFPAVNPTVITKIDQAQSLIIGFITSITFIVDIQLLFFYLSVALIIELILFSGSIAEWILNNVTLGFYKKRK